jgi:hypothetical protein
MNNFAVLQALAFEPRRAFTELDQRPRFLWPFLLVALSLVVINVWYTAVVDLEWLTDLQLRSSALTRNLTSAEIERLAARAAETRGVSMVTGAIGTVLVLAIIILLSGLYYLVAGKITGVDRSYRHWLAMTAWTTTPTLIVALASAVVLLTASSNQISKGDLQPRRSMPCCCTGRRANRATHCSPRSTCRSSCRCSWPCSACACGPAGAGCSAPSSPRCRSCWSTASGPSSR